MEFLKNVEPQIGAILRVKRDAGYYHFGVYYDTDTVCHYSGLTDDDINKPENIKIRLASLATFKKNGEIEVAQPDDTFLPIDEIKKRCDSYLGQNKFNGQYYSLIANNCEHFAKWACIDSISSKQVDDVLNLLSSLFK